MLFQREIIFCEKKITLPTSNQPTADSVVLTDSGSLPPRKLAYLFEKLREIRTVLNSNWLDL